MDPTPLPLTGLNDIFANLVIKVLGLAGLATFIMLVVGGISFITAGSEAPKAEAAKKTITYAIGGLVLLALAYLILNTISQFSGSEGIKSFNIFYQNP